MLTADDLLINWARGELINGEDPRPKEPSFCASAERYYRPTKEEWNGVLEPGVEKEIKLDDENQSHTPVNWPHHHLVSSFVKRQHWVVKIIICREWVDRFLTYRGLNRTARRIAISKQTGVPVRTVEFMIENVRKELTAFMRGKV